MFKCHPQAHLHQQPVNKMIVLIYLSALERKKKHVKKIKHSLTDKKRQLRYKEINVNNCLIKNCQTVYDQPEDNYICHFYLRFLVDFLPIFRDATF